MTFAQRDVSSLLLLHADGRHTHGVDQDMIETMLS